MKTHLTATLLCAVAFAAVPARAATVPCEDMLKQLRAAEAAATPSDADKATVADLEAKGIERCNADDDKRADDFFAQALKILGK
ncbi:hypothetical protein [Inquilinus limosus]|uniref:Secreted protein n=1 Tax=Inquilinus limosus TaxID=171674 RepID=A0A211ZM73_9PROT|nr:hypothetical protein [Inquilinus limosus]OWJ66187.1 hypothetical protein BWR60_15655 [Inquilinus limosus]